MKRLLTILLIMWSQIVTAQEFWIHSNEDGWNTAKRVTAVGYMVEVLNTCTTNSYEEEGQTIYVTNYVHTVENTNNLLLQINFSITNSAGENCWLLGYTVQKCGGFPVAEKWSILETWINKPQQSDWGCGFDMGLVEYMAQEGLGWQTNSWYTNNIPLVDDAKKVYGRQKQFKEKK